MTPEPHPSGGYTDSHCHLFDTRGVDPAEVIAAARAAGVDTMINVGCDAATTAEAIAIAALHDGVHATAGLHPHEAVHGVGSIVDYVDDPLVVAIGECGLDYFYERSPRGVQRLAFAEQIEIANELGMPLVVHSRDAWDDTLDVLVGAGVPERTVFHCFTGGPDEARRCLDVGAFLSFSGIVTFTTADDLRAAARLCPDDRLLAETDSPYLAPVPHRGRTNQPAYVTDVVAKLAEVRGTTLELVRDLTARNARLAFPRLRT
ncbi:MAG: putative deoxyribonuclease [Ilumatobacteraceae bacterium]|nr:putative deoxyribonuclease [Ilumatobacteraceae bacterium]